MIELNGLAKSYATTIALNNVNLFIQEGEIFGIIGKSGAGKSTLLRTINLLERPDCGEIVVDNEALTSLNPQKLRLARHKMAMIFQQFNLLSSKTVYDNIALPMRIQGIDETTIENKIAELLSLVELSEKKDRYPDQLSGGQKQRVAIARALSCSPKILLCDEATSALDPQTTHAILDLLKKINSIYGITIVLITHEMEVVKRICHRLALMENGKIIEVAALAALFNEPSESPAKKLLFSHLSPQLPSCLRSSLTSLPNNKPLLRIFFQGASAMTPFISKASRELPIDINILLANLDRFDGITWGAMIVELIADETLCQHFIQRCEEANIKVEILGYVNDHAL